MKNLNTNKLHKYPKDFGRTKTLSSKTLGSMESLKPSFHFEIKFSVELNFLEFFKKKNLNKILYFLNHT